MLTGSDLRTAGAGQAWALRRVQRTGMGNSRIPLRLPFDRGDRGAVKHPRVLGATTTTWAGSARKSASEAEGSDREDYRIFLTSL
jgi:hypothetical protein